MIKRLISIRLRAAFLGTLTGKDKNGNPKGQISTGRIVGYTLLYTFLALIFLFAVFSMAMGAGVLLLPAGAADCYFGIFMLLSLTVIFIFSIFETKSELFDCKDNELLLALPIRSGAIVLSRIFTVLIYNYIIEAIIAVPVTVVYLIFDGNILGVLGSIIVALLIPLLATALASGVGYLVALIARRMKHKTLVTTLLSMLFLGGYFFLYFGILGSSDDGFGETDEQLAIILSALRPFGVIGSAQLLSPVPLLLFVFVCAAASFLAYYFIQKNYIRIITETRGADKRVYVEKRSSKKSAVSAIVRKEFSRIFSSSAILLNGASGVIFLGILVIFLAVERDMLTSLILDLTGGTSSVAMTLAPVCIAATVASLAMIMFSASSLSLEGRNLWIIKSIPVSERDIIIAKTLPNIIISSVLGVVCGVSLLIITGFDIVCAVFYILTPITASIAFSFMGTVLNVAKPKFDYINETQAVKQSFPVFISTMVGMLSGIALIILAVASIIFGMPILFLIAAQLLMTALAIVFYFLAVTVCVRKLSSIQA